MMTAIFHRIGWGGDGANGGIAVSYQLSAVSHQPPATSFQPPATSFQLVILSEERRDESKDPYPPQSSSQLRIRAWL